MLIWVLLACNETNIGRAPVPPVASPPALPTDDRGSPPNWNDCDQGYFGSFSNLPITHPDVEPALDAPLPPLDPAELDWWDDPSFQRFSADLDFGANWWPVDEGLEGDPAYFSVRFVAWLRARSNTTMTFTLGASDDVWLMLGDEVLFEDVGIKPFAPATHSVAIGAGQYPFEVRYAHRSGGSGLRFRVLSGDVSICYARYDDDDDG